MKKIVLLAVVTVASASVDAQNRAALYDSTEVENLSEVVVQGVRAQKNAPYAISNLRKKELNDFSKTGRELPFLFAQTPGVVAWSENGMGTGTTYMRIRGAADSRINVTLDGVPLNSPEDQCVFWANMNSYGSLPPYWAACRFSAVWVRRPTATAPSAARWPCRWPFPSRSRVLNSAPAMAPITRGMPA
jgi:iron complex outermembrane receptor protein